MLDPHRQVPAGLRYCTNFITREEESEVLQVLDGPGIGEDPWDLRDLIQSFR